MGSAVSNTVPVVVPSGPALVLSAVTHSTFVQGGHLFNQNNFHFNSVGADHYEIWHQLNGGGFTLYNTLFGPFFPPINTGEAGLALSWVNGTYDYFILAKDAGGATLATSNTSSTTWP